MTSVSTTGRDGTPPPSQPPSSLHTASLAPDAHAHEGSRRETPQLAHSAKKPIKASKVAVRLVFSVEPTEKKIVVAFRGLLAKLLAINRQLKYANIQLLPISVDGTHISSINDLGHHEKAVFPYIDNPRMEQKKLPGGEVSYSFHGLIHLQHNIPFSILKKRMISYLRRS